MENDAFLIQIRVRDAKLESFLQGPMLCLTIQSKDYIKTIWFVKYIFLNPTI